MGWTEPWNGHREYTPCNVVPALARCRNVEPTQREQADCARVRYHRFTPSFLFLFDRS